MEIVIQNLPFYDLFFFHFAWKLFLRPLVVLKMPQPQHDCMSQIEDIFCWGPIILFPLVPSSKAVGVTS